MQKKRIVPFTTLTLAILFSFFIFQNCSKTQFESLSSTSTVTPTGTDNIEPENLEFTPSGCTDETQPTCSGGIDTVRKRWGTDSVNQVNGSKKGILSGANSTNGAYNTNQIIKNDPNGDAARFCAKMVYGGFDDWYLPSREELVAVFRNRIIYGALEKDAYWSSTEVSIDNAYSQSLVPFYPNGDPFATGDFTKATTFFVRCIRKK